MLPTAPCLSCDAHFPLSSTASTYFYWPPSRQVYQDGLCATNVQELIFLLGRRNSAHQEVIVKEPRL
uniref:Uncharacterized protein n=1 Tax=Mesocestoides corti TaxID=53468 RepID=A0A5K3FWV5_MESCO